MTITAAGFPGQVNDREWARILSLIGNDGTSGFNVSASSGDRSVSVSSGMSNVGGVLVESDAVEILQLPSNSSQYPRIDRVILRAVWSTASVQLTYRQGTPSTSPVPPALTRNPATQYEVALAEVRVEPGQGSLTSGNITRTNTPPATGFYYINSRAQSPDPADGALVYYAPQRELMVGTPSGYVTLAGGSTGMSWLPSPSAVSGWVHTSTYQNRAGNVWVHIDVERTGGNTSPNNVRLGILPEGSRPSRQIYAMVMNQHRQVPFTVEIRTSGLVSCINMQANQGQRIRGNFGFIAGG